MEMHDQRFRLALAAGLGLISPFFTWVNMYLGHDAKSLIAILSMDGFFSFIPIIILGCFILSLVISLSGDRSKQIKKFKFIRIIPSIICVGIGILLMSTFENAGDKPAIGLYLNLIASGFYILFTLVTSNDDDSKTKNNLQDNDSLNSNSTVLKNDQKKPTLFSTFTNYVVAILFLAGLIMLFNLDQFNFFSKNSEQTNNQSSNDFSWFHKLESYQQWILGIVVGAFFLYFLYEDVKKFFSKKPGK